MEWNKEAKRAYLACAIDTDGWVSLRSYSRSDDSSKRIQAIVGVTNQCKEFLERFAFLAEVPFNIGLNGSVGKDARSIITRSEVWQSQWSSPPQVLRILELAEPYLVAKRQRALWAIEFCKSRISVSGKVNRRWAPYTDRSWELCILVTLANGRTPKASYMCM